MKNMNKKQKGFTLPEVIVSIAIIVIVIVTTTNLLAIAAYQRAYCNLSFPVIGVATSSILQRTPIERENREHVIYVALQTSSNLVSN